MVFEKSRSDALCCELETLFRAGQRLLWPGFEKFTYREDVAPCAGLCLQKELKCLQLFELFGRERMWIFVLDPNPARVFWIAFPLIAQLKFLRKMRVGSKSNLDV
jgi:hypothetical protein